MSLKWLPNGQIWGERKDFYKPTVRNYTTLVFVHSICSNSTSLVSNEKLKSIELAVCLFRFLMIVLSSPPLVGFSAF